MRLAASSTGPLCNWEPKEGMQLSGRREYVARLFVYATARKMRFVVTKDTGATLEHTCRSCRVGKITLRIKRTRDYSGDFAPGHATIASVLSCPCSIQHDKGNFSNLTPYIGLKYSSRPEFTEIGKAYFSGRRHSRRDSGNRIDYRCLVCRNGHLSAFLTPGISKETGRPTWTAPVTVDSAANCTPKCASLIDLVTCYSFCSVECIFCLKEANSPVELLCCRPTCKTRKKYLCHGCLKEWVDRCRNRIRLDSADGPCAAPSDKKSCKWWYSCPCECGAKWSDETRFIHEAQETPLHELCEIPIEAAKHPKLAEVQEDELQSIAELFPNSRSSVPLEIICQSLREQSSLDGRYEVLALNGFTDRATAYNFMRKNNLYLEQKVDSVPDTQDARNPTKRHVPSQLRKQMKMHNFFKIRK